VAQHLASTGFISGRGKLHRWGVWGSVKPGRESSYGEEMKRILVAVAFLVLGLSSAALGQQAKLEGYVFDDRDNRVSVARIVAPGGQAAQTDSQGHFSVAFPPSVRPGQATHIDVVKQDWVVHEPLLGNCVTQSSERNYEPLKVIIVPKGSPLALAPKRLSQVIARWADERVKLRSQLDEYAFLKEYSERYGFTLNQFLAAAQGWAQTKDSDDMEEQAFKEYFLKNYDRAAHLAHESALEVDKEIERLSRQTREVSLKMIRRFKLEGNALYAQYKFREALAEYKEIENRFSARKLSKEDLVREWGEIKVLLGSTRLELGVRAEGQESDSLLSQSLADYSQALAVFTPEQSPQDWAMTQNNLGAALSSQGARVSGDGSVRLLGQAVDAYRQALTVYTRDQLPQDWAGTQNNLGVALRSQGERVSGGESVRLLGQAVDACRQALTVYTRDQLPQQWAMTQNNLGVVLTSQGERVSGEESVRLLGQAVDAYRQALTVYTRDQLPQGWAMTQNNLGVALTSQGERVSGEESVRLVGQAIDAYRQALTVRTHDELPQDWAVTQNNLGTALSRQAERVSGEESVRLLRQAVDAYQQALTVRTRDQLPQDWAVTQNNLGAALSSRGERVSGEESVRLLGQAVDA
jgi:tetratricopeptide (TPR) repeat protein